MRNEWRLLWLGIVVAAVPAAGAEVDYRTQIKPLLTEKCYSCHGVLKQEAGLRLETRALMLAGGDSGAVLVPHDPTASLIIERVTEDEDLRMPPASDGARLKPAELALLREWIAAGAPAPDEPTPAAPSEHWAFQPVQRSQRVIREAAAGTPPAHVIDQLLEFGRREKGLTAGPPAERSLLIRRVYLDLVGLPPTRAQLDDPRPFEEIVDELLASPQHGERWGRHWMDVWRYSDWYGLGSQLRNSQKHLWRWRDWIIASLNEDKGYDRMIQEMLAGDELAPEDPEAVVGTGFLARNYYLFNRTTWLDDTIEHTSKAFLGLTFNCAKCHDHKYDPLPQLDYYRLRAIFEPHQVRLDPIAGVVDFEQDGLPRVFDDQPEIETWLHVRGDPSNPDKSQPVPPGMPTLFSFESPAITPVSLPVTAYAPGLRPEVQQDRLQAASRAISQAEQALAAARSKQAEIVAAMSDAEVSAANTEFAITDDFESPNSEVWDLVGPGWEYRDGALHQTQAGRDQSFARLREALPRDFELVCHYTTTGGTTYRSVTFRFDESSDRSQANFVYTSAYEAGPKVQAAWRRGGETTYPKEFAVSRKIPIGEAVTLRLAVRDRLANVWLNDEFILACEFPDRPTGGSLSLSGFDATVAFDSLTLRSLPKDLELKQPGKSDSLTPDAAQLAVDLAAAKLEVARAEEAAIRATIAADNALLGTADSGNGRELAAEAAHRQAAVDLAQARVELLQAGQDEGKLKAARARITRAEERLTAEPSAEPQYESLRASIKALETPAHKEADYPAVYSPVSTGRRLALAQWITSPQNPLTARVAVNHVWMRHFGTPLVESVFDFGLRAPRPVQAELLDELAAEFVASGWSFKHLHRLIVTSQAYQMSSTTTGAAEQAFAADPNNDYYSRGPVRRMESQVVRDSLLALAGTLDLSLGGPPVATGAASRRRSLYFRHSRDGQDQFLKMFDDADLLQCYRRSESIIPQQALALSNSELAFQMAPLIAERISAAASSGEPESFISTAFETILARPATDAEQKVCQTFLSDVTAILRADAGLQDKQQLAKRAHTRLVQGLLNHNDFITIR